jgi:putative addiction module component (TIGR02574 family)
MGFTMPTFQEVLSAARTLNTTERIRLANSLWDDVPPAEWPLPDAEWIAEAQQRSAEYDAGRISAFTWLEVQARSRQRAGLNG